MKNIIIVLLLCVSFFAYTLSANAEIKREAGYISLNNSLVKEVEPNLATITFAVENTASEAQKAANENNEISDKIIKALKLIASNQTDTIKTSNFSVNPVWGTTPAGKRVIKNYSAVNSVRVETKDVSKVAKFIDTAIANGANRTDNLVYSLQNEKKICKELYPTLVKELTTMAQDLASSAGTTLDGLKQMNVSCNTDTVSNGRFFTAKAMAVTNDMAESASIETPVEAGKIKIRVYVNADYYVK